MLAKEKRNIRTTLSIRIVEHKCTGHVPQQSSTRHQQNASLPAPLFEFAGSSPATFAERFPRLMVCAIAASVILTALAAEIECLRAMGYYWP
jgi:hypothetical protein